ncbi:MAG: hypothetical protein KAI95_13165 [Bacteroidales bacterium]|nr:hypothetical protein [Bacteroidales bacterium]
MLSCGFLVCILFVIHLFPVSFADDDGPRIFGPPDRPTAPNSTSLSDMSARQAEQVNMGPCDQD